MISIRMIILVFIFTLTPIITFAAECQTIFNKLDKQYYAITDQNRIKKLTQLENDLFKAIEQCKTYSGMFVLMGEVQIDMGQIPLAVVYGQKAVGLDEEYWRAHKLLGSSLMLNSKAESGLKSLMKAVALQPENINSQLNLASALIQNKKYDDALKLINNIIHKNEKGTLATAYYLRSQAYSGKGLIIEADKDFKTARRMGFVVPQ